MSLAFIIAAALAALVVFIVALVARTLSVRRAPPAGSLAPDALDGYAGAEAKLAALVRIPTVSRFDPAEEDGSTFAALLAELPRLYPLVFSRLLRTDVGDRGLLLEWPGSDHGAAPAVMMAHFDVVPAGDAAAWEHPPFSGDAADGFIHGRGTQDIKITLSACLEASERLLSRGFVPRRTIFLAFGGDEETGGVRGAAAIAAALKARGVRASFALDEGGFVARGMLSFVDRPLALVGISEKGYVDVAIEAEGAGGHASMPPRHTAAGTVARAVALSEARPFPGVLTYTLRRFLEALVPYAPFAYRFLFRNLFLTGPLVKAAFSASPTTNALVRTTAAATMLSGSDKENVLPDKARAILNVRVLPGSSVAGVMGRLGSIAREAGASASFAHLGHANDPLPESPVDHEGYRAVSAAIADAFPEAGVVPFMFTAGTDTKHYKDVAEAIYRFAPILQSNEDIARVHAANERISVDNVRRACLFYERLLSGL